MFVKLPDFADPYLLCDKGSAFSGQIPLSVFSRLSPLLADCDDVVTYHLSFGKDDDGYYVIDNSVQAVLRLQCQRCLSVFDHDIDVNVRISPVLGIQEAEQIPDHYEPLLLTDGDPLPMVDLIEDELILSVPDVPMHLDTECEIKLAELNQNRVEISSAAPAASEVDNPFAVLAQLKQQIK